MLNKGYKLDLIKLNDVINKLLLHRLNDHMNGALNLNRKWFDYSFELKGYIKTSWFSTLTNIEDFKYEVNELEAIKDLTLVCNSRKWTIIFFIEGDSPNNAVLTFRIGGK